MYVILLLGAAVLFLGGFIIRLYFENRKLKTQNERLLPFQIVDDVLEQYAVEDNIVKAMRNINVIILDILDIDFSTILIKDEINEKLSVFVTNIEDRAIEGELERLLEWEDEGFEEAIRKNEAIVRKSDIPLTYPSAQNRSIRYAALLPLNLNDGKRAYWLLEDTSDFSCQSKWKVKIPNDKTDEGKIIQRNLYAVTAIQEAVGMLLGSGLLRYLDELMQIPKRDFLLSRIDEAIKNQENFGVAFIDIDNFKGVNDEFGHSVGDDVLKCVASCLKESVRSCDMVGRYGGEEILLYIHDVDSKKAFDVAERARENLENMVIPGQKFKITVSIGVALYEEDFQKKIVESKEILELADKRLYVAKESGKNKTVIGEQE